MDDFRRKFLADILGSIEEIVQFTCGLDSLQAYESNRLVRRAVERNIEIIGEAVKRITEGEIAVPVENARQIIATRNRVIHGYDSVTAPWSGASFASTSPCCAAKWNGCSTPPEKFLRRYRPSFDFP